MMQDLAMQILEILMNSIHADSTFIEVHMINSVDKDIISFGIIDDGKGMGEEVVKKICDPFITSRTTRKIGMGVSFLKGLTDQCNGSFNIVSEVGRGTTVYASVQKTHWDVPPFGDLGEMMMIAIQSNENIDYLFTYKTDIEKFIFDSKEIRLQIEGISILEPDILIWIREYINQGIQMTKEKQL